MDKKHSAIFSSLIRKHDKILKTIQYRHWKGKIPDKHDSCFLYQNNGNRKTYGEFFNLRLSVLGTGNVKMFFLKLLFLVSER